MLRTDVVAYLLSVRADVNDEQNRSCIWHANLCIAYRCLEHVLRHAHEPIHMSKGYLVHA